MKRMFWLVLVLALAFSGMALAKESADEVNVASAAKDAVNNVFAALKAHNWDLMRKDFSDEMLKALSKEKLTDVFGDLEKQRGAYVSNSFAKVVAKDEWILVFYTAKFAKSDALLQFTFKKSDPTCKVCGLFVRPAESAKRATKEEAEALLKTYQPVIDGYFAAYKARDFAGMEKDFSDKMHQALPVDKFKAAVEKDIEGVYGMLKSSAFDRIETDPDCIIVYYLVTRDKGQTALKFVFGKGDAAHKVMGLWENPL